MKSDLISVGHMEGMNEDNSDLPTSIHLSQ